MLKDAWYNRKRVISVYKFMVTLVGDAVVFWQIAGGYSVTKIGKTLAENRQGG